MRPHFKLSPEAQSELKSDYPRLLEEVELRFDVSAAEPVAELAEEICEMLDGLVMSSDTDVPFWPSMVIGLSDDPWRALGIDRAAIVRISGWERPKLAVIRGAGAELFFNLDSEELERTGESLDNYLAPEEEERFAAAAARLGEHGDVMQIILACPEESARLMLTVVSTGRSHVGVFSVSLEA